MVIVLAPVIADPGDTPTLRLIVVVPGLVTVEPARTEKAVAVPSGTTTAAACALPASGPATKSATRAAAEVRRTLRRGKAGVRVGTIGRNPLLVTHGALPRRGVHRVSRGRCAEV